MTNAYYLARITASHCCVCRSPLTDAESVDSGIGPICSKRYYNPRHTPTENQVKIALGRLAASGLSEDIIDGFLAVVDNHHTNARAACNLLVKWASANYDNRDMIFKCSGIIRALGYDELANKLEDDRTTATVRTLADHIEAFIPDKYPLERSITSIPGAVKLVSKLGRKVGWSIPLDQADHFEAVLGFHCGGELACGDARGIRTIARKRWADVVAFRNPPSTSAPISPVQITSLGRTLEVYSPFNQDFITALKNNVPVRDRRWTGRCWEVTAIFRNVVESLVAVHYGAPV
jgi:hypothetical protein